MFAYTEVAGICVDRPGLFDNPYGVALVVALIFVAVALFRRFDEASRPWTGGERYRG